MLSYVELMYQGRLREFIQDGLTRGTKYLPMIQSVFRAEGLPLDLAYIPIIESGFKTNALSKASAKGPWQFMKPTAQGERAAPGLVHRRAVGSGKVDRRGGQVSEDAAQAVQRRLEPGPGRIQRRPRTRAAGDEEVRTRGLLGAVRDRPGILPKETREYVPLILAAIIVAKNPAQYGFDIVAHDPIAYDKVTLPRAMDLRRVAEWTGASIDEIQALNPELRRWTTPVEVQGIRAQGAGRHGRQAPGAHGRARRRPI